MKITATLLSLFILFGITAVGQSPSYQTFVNPVIPGDHPDPTLTKIDDYFYTSGSSFNPTPKIYRSKNLVHWEVVAQPVASDWNTYGDSPGGGVWGGHTVRYNGDYWHYFGRGGGQMYFVKANTPTAAWSTPTALTVPSGINSLGVDNSIFIDEDTNKWYLLTKAGHENNHLVELGEDGQPNGNVLDLTWLNPNAEDNPYGWAEGPVMWKHNGFYYYSFAEHLVGQQYVMRSDTLTDNPDDWTIRQGTMFTGTPRNFDRPNHISPAVTLSDGTSWVIGHSYYSGAWQAHGRQGLLMQVTYDEDNWPIMEYPQNAATTAPDLPNGNIPWMVPKSDMFNTARMQPEWSLLGFTPKETYSLAERAGWLYLEPHNGSNTVIQNDGEHSYSLITRVEFDPDSENDQAGLWIMNGPETMHAKVYLSQNSSGESVIGASFQETVHEVENTIGNTVWLKLVRDQHDVIGYYSNDGIAWTQIGEPLDVAQLDIEQTQFNDFTGNQQGLYVEGASAFFDLYIYRDAYTKIPAINPINFSGVSASTSGSYLGSIQDGDWALYAGVEFGDESGPSNTGVDYQKAAKGISIEASSSGTGGVVEVWADAIDTGTKIAEVNISSTDDWNTYQTFNAPLLEEIEDSHDIYFKFSGEETGQLFRIRSFRFSTSVTVSNEGNASVNPESFKLGQNYPNPFNPTTKINYSLPEASVVKLNVYDMLGREVATLVNEPVAAGSHQVSFDAGNLSSGLYIYRITAGEFISTRKMMLIK